MGGPRMLVVWVVEGIGKSAVFDESFGLEGDEGAGNGLDGEAEGVEFDDLRWGRF